MPCRLHYTHLLRATCFALLLYTEWRPSVAAAAAAAAVDDAFYVSIKSV